MIDIGALQPVLVLRRQPKSRSCEVAGQRAHAIGGAKRRGEPLEARARRLAYEHVGVSIALGQLAEQVAADEPGTPGYEPHHDETNLISSSWRPRGYHSAHGRHTASTARVASPHASRLPAAAAALL